MATNLAQPVYPIAGKLYSITDLLSSFIDQNHFLRGRSRYSDLHLKTGEVAMFRYDGDMCPIPGGLSLTPDMVRSLLIPLLRENDAAQVQRDDYTDIDTSWEWTEHDIMFRLNIFRDKDGPAAVIRALPAHIPALADVGFPDPDVWKDIVNLNQGLVLLVGNTGSGKSTTIASILNHINQTRPVRIISLEDPIEYVFRSQTALFSQRELGQHIKSLSLGLRSALREDPDIIFVGEMRDLDTISLALTAAETGHLVFSTLHTRDTRGAITRIIDMFPAERGKEISVQLSMGLSYVICQKLVRNLAGGRSVAMEVLHNTASVSNLIRSGSLHQIATQLETRTKEGMITLEAHLKHLVQTGTISVTEAMEAANDPAALRLLFTGASR